MSIESDRHYLSMLEWIIKALVTSIPDYILHMYCAVSVHVLVDLQPVSIDIIYSIGVGECNL